MSELPQFYKDYKEKTLHAAATEAAKALEAVLNPKVSNGEVCDLAQAALAALAKEGVTP